MILQRCFQKAIPKCGQKNRDKKLITHSGFSAFCPGLLVGFMFHFRFPSPVTFAAAGLENRGKRKPKNNHQTRMFMKIRARVDFNEFMEQLMMKAFVMGCAVLKCIFGMQAYLHDA
jgi:hypothetical protein